MPRGGNRRQNIFTGGNTFLRVRIVLERGLSGPVLPLRVDALDPVFVLKCKVEVALRLLRETQGEDAIGRTAKAEDIELEYRGIPLRDMTSIDRYGIEGGAEIAAAFVPQPTEKMLVPREAEYQHLDAQIMAEPGVPSTGTIKRIVAKCGKTCQVCWRSRWFRAEILSIYSTSILLKWADWDEAEWPNFFVHVSLVCDAASNTKPPARTRRAGRSRFSPVQAAAPGAPPTISDDTWRIRWHPTTPTSRLPIVIPRYRELSPLNWVKAFLRTYAASDESQMLREIQSTLPRELVEARQYAAAHHRCLILGASGVGKSTMVATFTAGPPPPAIRDQGALDGLSATPMGAGPHRGSSTYWPTVGTRCSHGTVHTPGLAPLQVEMWDTSGNPRFKPLSLVFYRQAQSVILVFDVKSMKSFRDLSAVGGWMHEFTRLTGASPRNFPFVLVGNKSEDDVMAHRQVHEEDVREWLYKDGGRMPYLETSFGGDPRADWRHAEHVFRTVARTAHRMKENFGRHRPPETVRVAPEADFSDETSTHGGSFVGNLVEQLAAPGGMHRGASLGEKLADAMRDPLQKVTRQAEDLLQRGKRSLENVKGQLPPALGGQQAKGDQIVVQTKGGKRTEMNAGQPGATALVPVE